MAFAALVRRYYKLPNYWDDDTVLLWLEHRWIPHRVGKDPIWS